MVELNPFTQYADPNNPNYAKTDPQPQPQPQAQDQDTDPGGWQTAGDIAAQATDRAVAGVIDIPGIPADLESSAEAIGNWARNRLPTWLGGYEEPTPFDPDATYAAELEKWSGLPLQSESLKKWIGYTPREATTPQGQWFDRNIGRWVEAAPAAVLTGGSGAAKSLLLGELGAKEAIPEIARRIAKYDVGPQLIGGAASSVAQAAGMPDDVQQMADISGQLLGTGVMGLRRHGEIEAPSTNDLASQSLATKAAAANIGLKIDPSAFQQWYDATQNAIPGMVRQSPTIYSQTNAALQSLRRRASMGDPVTFDDLDTANELLSQALVNSSGKDSEYVSQIQKSLNNWVNGLPKAGIGTPSMAGGAVPASVYQKFVQQVTGGATTNITPQQQSQIMGLVTNYLQSGGTKPAVIAGDAQEALKHLQDFNSQRSIKSQADIIDSALTRANNSSKALNGNLIDAYRDQLRNILNNPSLFNQFPLGVQQQIQDMVRGNRLEKLLRTVGSYAPGSEGAKGMAWILPVMLEHMANWHGVMAGAAVTRASKTLGESFMERGVNSLPAMVRAQSQNKVPFYPGLRPSIVQSGYYLGDPSRQEGENPFLQYTQGQ